MYCTAFICMVVQWCYGTVRMKSTFRVSDVFTFRCLPHISLPSHPIKCCCSPTTAHHLTTVHTPTFSLSRRGFYTNVWPFCCSSLDHMSLLCRWCYYCPIPVDIENSIHHFAASHSPKFSCMCVWPLCKSCRYSQTSYLYNNPINSIHAHMMRFIGN